MWKPWDNGSSGKSGSCTASLQLSPRHCCTAQASDVSIATASWDLETASVEPDTWGSSVCDGGLSVAGTTMSVLSCPMCIRVGSLISDPSTGGNTWSQCCSLAIILLTTHCHNHVVFHQNSANIRINPTITADRTQIIPSHWWQNSKWWMTKW